MKRAPSNDHEVRAILDALRDSNTSGTTAEETIARIKLLMEYGRLGLAKLSPRAHEAFFSDQSLQDRFLASKSGCDAFILSIDIRRSTELMLKARTPIRVAAAI